MNLTFSLFLGGTLLQLMISDIRTFSFIDHWLAVFFLFHSSIEPTVIIGVSADHEKPGDLLVPILMLLSVFGALCTYLLVGKHQFAETFRIFKGSFLKVHDNTHKYWNYNLCQNYKTKLNNVCISIQAGTSQKGTYPRACIFDHFTHYAFTFICGRKKILLLIHADSVWHSLQK